jgi:hypothetical protein
MLEEHTKTDTIARSKDGRIELVIMDAGMTTDPLSTLFGRERPIRDGTFSVTPRRSDGTCQKENCASAQNRWIENAIRRSKERQPK